MLYVRMNVCVRKEGNIISQYQSLLDVLDVRDERRRGCTCAEVLYLDYVQLGRQS